MTDKNDPHRCLLKNLRPTQGGVLFCVVVGLITTTTHLPAEDLAPPKTLVKVVTDEMHGIKIPDPYRWLEDQESPETRAWITEQNAYTRRILDAVPGRDRLRARLEELSRVDFQSAPIVRNGLYFYQRRSVKSLSQT